MDITARELLDGEIREAFRGYHHDDVNDLLERAASTIDGLTERVRQLGERLAASEKDTGRNRETEDILHRTLLLAQRAADEAVAEAQQQAQKTIEEAESQARRMLAEAEADLRRRVDGERRRLEDEITEFAGRRDALLADVESLARHEAEYRERLVLSIEADLQMLTGRAPAAPGPRPAVHEVAMPAYPEAVVAPGTGADEPTQALRVAGASLPEPESPEESPEAEVAVDQALPTPAPPTEDPGPETAPPPSASEIDLSGEEQVVEAEVLDDDAFFATLRDAVRDEGPLGPRDEDAGLFDQDDTESGSFRELFKRRR
ncbi:MAG: DivIVA domain-containing protein [Acidimicrobiia bacterium]|nr:DivIVA domain-containing protein [Acidimicrobiia bacterium]